MTTSSDGEPPAHGPIPKDVAVFVERLARLWDDRLGDGLAGVHLIGSLAHGGYSIRYSDIDIALVARYPLTAGDLEHVSGEIAAHTPALAAKLSLFWADETFSAGRFPPLDRIDYLDHRLPLLERRCLLPPRPTLPQIRTYLQGEALRRWSQEAMRLGALHNLGPGDHKPFLRALLYPARFFYSWDTGGVASNDDAVAYAAKRNLAGADLIARALVCRNAGNDASLLFPERHRLPDLVRVCIELTGPTR